MIDDTMLYGTWTTPGGHPATFGYRDGTVDWNVLTSILTNDEYSLAKLDPGTIALDIGAYIGGWAIGAALDYPDCHIYAVEPIPENLAILRDNIERNGVGYRITVVEGMVGTGTIAYGGTDSDASRQNAWVGNTIGEWFHPTKTVTPKRVRFDDFPRPSFVKIDCEGGEWTFLDDPAAGAVRTIVGEVHDIGLGFRQEFASMLTPTHDVVFAGSPEGCCGFLAMRRE